MMQRGLDEKQGKVRGGLGEGGGRGGGGGGGQRKTSKLFGIKIDVEKKKYREILTANEIGYQERGMSRKSERKVECG